MAGSASESNQGKFSVTLVIAGNVATILSSAESTRSLIVNTVGVGFLRHLMILFAFVILLGYIAAFSWFARRFIIGGSTARTYSWGILAMLLLPAVLLANYAMLPARADPALIIKERTDYWSNDLISSYQEPNGGILALPSDPSSGAQVWTTAQVLKGVLASNTEIHDANAIRQAFHYMEKRRRSDGWSLYDEDDYSVNEITAWVVLANLEALRRGVWSGRERESAVQRVKRDLDLLRNLQLPDGSWSPVPQGAMGTGRTYSSLMAIWVLAEAGMEETLGPAEAAKSREILRRAVRWLFKHYSQKNGWAPNPGRSGQTKFYQALSSHVLFVLNRAERMHPLLARDSVYVKAKREYLTKVSPDRPAFPDDHLQGSDSSILGRLPRTRYQLEGSTYLGYPWSVAAYTILSQDPKLTEQERLLASEIRNAALLTIGDHMSQLGSDGNYEVAENLFCFSHMLNADELLASASKESSLLALLSSAARNLPGQERQSPLFAYIVTVTGVLMIFLAARVFIWRRRAPRLQEAKSPLSEATILLPVRNEEGNVSECLGSLLQQAALSKVVVIDDGSTDRTQEIARRFAAENSHVSVITAGELPADWKGKVHALEAGLRTVTTPWILSTDADTRHGSDLLARTLATAEARKLDSISIAGFQETLGLGENLLTPSVFAVLDSILGDWRDVADGESKVANGQFFLVRTEALRSIGGFAAIRKAALDDVALANRLREGGLRHSFFRAPDLLRIRMYRGWMDTFRGWRRNLGAIFFPQKALSAYVLFLLLFPMLLLLWGAITRDWGAVVVTWLAGALASVIFRMGSGHPPAVGLLYPLDALALACCISLGIFDASRGKLASWKGRTILLDSR